MFLNDSIRIIDSMPIPVCKFARAYLKFIDEEFQIMKISDIKDKHIKDYIKFIK